MSIKEFAGEFLHGLKDSILGIGLVFKLDSEVAAPASRTESTVVQQRTKLALRRERDARRENAARPAGSPRAESEELIQRTPTPAKKRLVQCIGVNVAMVVSVRLLAFLCGFVADALFGDSTPIVVLGTLAHTVAVLPIFIVTRVMNALWFADVASACKRHLGDKIAADNAQNADLSKHIADFVVSTLLEVVFCLQAVCVRSIPIPILSSVLYWLHMSLLYSLYSFEYGWFSAGVPLRNRRARIENRPAYFAGFGAPLVAATTFTDDLVVSGCFFGALFPFFIIASFQAPWNAVDRSRQPSRLQIFMLADAITNSIATRISDFIMGRMSNLR